MDPAIETTVRLALAGLLLFAGWHKARAFRRFRTTVVDYRLVPEPLASLAAVAVLGTEVVLGLALLVPGAHEAALLAAAGLFALYAGAIALNLVRGRRHVDCGCMGPTMRQPLSEWLVARNAVLVLLGLACLLPIRSRPLHPLDLMTITGGLAFLAALWGAVNQLIANGPDLARLRGQP